eukprot:scpid54143/ scgid16819/ Tissue alpha-L-fucosidase; Alpha-L-fucosidase I; Alpha-L-fucoside fucohydrolase 1
MASAMWHFVFLAIAVAHVRIAAGMDDQSPFYFPTNITWFKEAKFGLFMHWGPVSQWGTEISFPLVCKKLPCTVQTKGPNSTQITTIEELQQHRQSYADLAKTFNPTKFDPVAMAKLAKAVGFKYLVFTVEHCDGFANYNSKVSSYNILNTPYKQDTYAMLVKAFRAEGLRVGAYYCPSTWNNDDYWQPNALTALGPVCRPNYKPASDPERWENYLKYLLGQLSEIASQYAPDIVWIDCSEELNSLDTRVESVGHLFRKANPEVVMQIRGAGGWEDYLETGDKQVTLVDAIMSEQMMTAGVHFEIPDTLANGPWAFSPTVSYQTPQSVIGKLVTLNSKGGNYLLNLGPGPDGLWPDAGIAVLNEVADWMAINSESIEGTREQWPHDFTSLPAYLPSQRHFVMATPNGTYMYATSLTANTGESMYKPLVSHARVGNDLIPSRQLDVCMAFVRNTTLRKKLTEVRLLGSPSDIDYILNASGLWLSVDLPVTLAQLNSYWSSGLQDTAPCATRGCQIYTQDKFVEVGQEGYCFAGPSEGMVALSLIFNSAAEDNAMVYNTSNYTSHGYGVVRTECYAYPTKQNGLAAVDLYWNEARKDLWTLASETSRQKAMQQGYVFVATQGYILPMSTPVTPATLKYAYVYRMKFE